MHEDIRDPREDISYIKNILARTADGMKSVAPWFARLGIVWLIYGILSAALRLAGVLGSLMLQVPLSNVGAVSGWAFYVFLAVGFFKVRRNLKQNGLDSLALKLVDMWGVCILVFLFLCVILVVIPIFAIRGMAMSQEAMNSIGYTLSICRSFLIFLLPLLPLLITAVFLENRRMLWMGIGLVILAAAFLGSHIILLWGSGLSGIEVSAAWIAGWNLAACLLDILPGVMLLLFARDLKRG